MEPQIIDQLYPSCKTGFMFNPRINSDKVLCNGNHAQCIFIVKPTRTVKNIILSATFPGAANYGDVCFGYYFFKIVNALLRLCVTMGTSKGSVERFEEGVNLRLEPGVVIVGQLTVWMGLSD